MALTIKDSLHRYTPPSIPEPYVIPCYSGELWTIPASNSVMRLLVTGKETEGAFAIVGSGGTFDNPIGFHYHNHAHDVFLCLKGTMNVWADDEARELGPGDFASVPPGTIHQYQYTSSHTENIGLIIPGGWEEFFRFVGEPFASGPLFPTHDKRNPFQVLVPRLIAAAETMDMIPVRDKPTLPPTPWTGAEKVLPGASAKGGYFLKADTGPKFEVGGWVVRPLARREESNGSFSIYAVEGGMTGSGSGSGVAGELKTREEFPGVLGSGGSAKKFRFAKTHHAIYIAEGQLKFIIEGKETVASTAETTFVPAGASFAWGAESRYVKSYWFANGGGVGETLTRVGRVYEWAVVPVEEDVGVVEALAVEALGGELGFNLV